MTTAGLDRRVLATMVLGVVLNPINSTIIAVALVPIGLAFGAPPEETAWLVSALYLATAVGQPVAGRLVDILGPRPLYLAGAALVGAAGLVGTLAQSLGVLVLARILLGLGTCAGYPAAMYLVRHDSDREVPSGALTALAVAGQVVAAGGPAFGGLLIDLGGWRATFAINLPLALLCLVLGWTRLPRGHEQRTGGGGLDAPGMALFAGTLTAFLLLVMRPSHWYLGLVVAGVGAGLVVRELRVADPFIDLRVLGGNLPLLVTFGRTVLTFTVAYAFLFGYTQWLEHARGLSPTAAGLVLLPTFLIAIAVAAVTGRNPRVRGKLVGGATAQVIGCCLMLFLHDDSSIWFLLTIAVIIGVPQGLNNLGNQNAMYHQADPARIGASAGLLRTFFYLGAILAAAASGAFFGHGADTDGMHELAWFMLGNAVLFLAASVLDRSLRRIPAPP